MDNLVIVNELKQKTSEYFNEIGKRTSEDYSKISRLGDELSWFDVLSVVVFGFVGGAISNNDQLKDFMDNIHTDASSNNPKTILGKLLHHKGDVIDHTTRNGEDFATYLHRLYGGHDPFSIGHGDNPFVLLCEQYGIPKGIIQAIRHLIADTFSKQGGTLPFSSFLDFKKEDGSIGNFLDEWSKEVAKGTGLNPQQVYSELFTIKAQDLTSVLITDVLVKAYVKIKTLQNPNNFFSKTGISQLKIIALLTNVLTSAIWGAAKHNGVPNLNIPAIFKLIVEIINFFVLNYKDLGKMTKEIKKFEMKVSLLEKEIYQRGESLPTYETLDEYVKEIDTQYQSFDKLFS